MAEKSADPLTTEIQIPVDNAVIADLLGDRYARMERGEVRGELEELYGQVWSEDQLQEQFDVQSLEPPYAHVVRKADGVSGTVACVHQHRFYFLFKPEEACERSEA